jgi:enoyl-CoA hydratase/carnithine racemase
MREIGSGLVKVDVDGHRADVVLNRPEKRNAMNRALLSDLLQAIEEVQEDTEVRAMTLLGEGPVFSAGMDLEMMRDRGEQGAVGSDEATGGLRKVTDALADSRVPVVAGLKRAAPAGAFELSLPADFRVISEDAQYGVIEVTLGMFPTGGAPSRLARLVGLGKAKEMVLSGEFIDPEEAKQFGLVNEVCEAEDVDERARAWADKLAKNAPLGMERARKVLNSTLQMPLEESLDYESALGDPLTETDDYTEGFTARIEDREPEFERK